MPSERKAAVRHLTRATTYDVTVEVGDRSGNVATSNTVSMTTPPSTDFEPPTVPGNLRYISEQGDCEVALGWDPSTDNVDAESSIRTNSTSTGRSTISRSAVTVF